MAARERRLSHRRPDTEFVFTGADGGLHRRSNFRRRVWIPALTGGDDANAGGRPPIQPSMHFHDLRHTPKTRLIEDRIREVVPHQCLGNRFGSVMGTYSHVTRPMIDDPYVQIRSTRDTAPNLLPLFAPRAPNSVGINHILGALPR